MRKKSLIALLSLFLLISTASAQPENVTEESRDVLVELDKATWVSSIDWNPGNQTRIKVTIQSEVPKLISVQELPDYQGRSGSFEPMKSVTLNSGENTVYVPVNGRNTLGIALTTSNNGAYYRQQSQNIPDPTSIDAVFIGIYGAASTFIVFISMRGWSKFQLKRGLIRE